MPPEEETKDSRPFFVIPYWPASSASPGDIGVDRPLPDPNDVNNPFPVPVIWYLCSGIHTSTYKPGEVLEVTVDIRNSGGSNAPALAQVTVWWSDPTLGFQVKPENLIGFRTVSVPPRGGTGTTTVMMTQMPADAPDHICLLARVSHPLDSAPPLPDPVNDRHWAQRNLAVIRPPAGQPAIIPFSVVNILADSTQFKIIMRPTNHAQLLADVDGVNGTPGETQAVLALDEIVGEGSLEIDVELPPGDRRIVTASIEAPDLRPGSYAAFEIAQELGDTRLGGIGVVVLGVDEM
jgi:hypothetical protein